MLDVASVLALFAAISTFVIPHAVVVLIGVFTALTFPLVNRLHHQLWVSKGPKLARVNLVHLVVTVITLHRFLFYELFSLCVAVAN